MQPDAGPHVGMHVVCVCVCVCVYVYVCACVCVCVLSCGLWHPLVRPRAAESQTRCAGACTPAPQQAHIASASALYCSIHSWDWTVLAPGESRMQCPPMATMATWPSPASSHREHAKPICMFMPHAVARARECIARAYAASSVHGWMRTARRGMPEQTHTCSRPTHVCVSACRCP